MVTRCLTVAKFKSQPGGDYYYVKLDLGIGTLSCNCLSWLSKRYCQHTKYASAHRNMRLTRLPTEQEMARMEKARGLEEKERWTIAHLQAIELKEEFLMRILVNYACENKGHTYSVTLEAVSETGKDKVNSIADELFAKAKETIHRQIEHQLQPAEAVPTAKEETPAKKTDKNKTSKPKRESWRVNPKNRKTEIKHPNADATGKQKGYIQHLAKQKGRFIQGLNAYTKAQAGQLITELLAV